MSKTVRNDWEWSDIVFDSQSTINLLKKFYGDIHIKKATEKEDIHYNIDYYINDLPVQWRSQRLENIKGSIEHYYSTLRYTRICSSHEDRKESELLKIVRNKKNGLPHPIHHIWCLADKNCKIVKCIIIDVAKFVSDYHNEEYDIWDTNARPIGKQINKSTTGKIISIKQNLDKSSEFIVLNEKYLLPNTIVYKYTN